jgi:hypothetical protein
MGERTDRAVDVMERIAVQGLVVRMGTRLEEVALDEEGFELAFTNDACTVLRRNNTVGLSETFLYRPDKRCFWC